MILNPTAQQIAIGDVQITPSGVKVLLTRAALIMPDGSSQHFASLGLSISDLANIGELFAGAIQTIRHARAQMAPFSPLEQ